MTPHAIKPPPGHPDLPHELYLRPETPHDHEVCEKLIAGCKLLGYGRRSDGTIDHVRVPLVPQTPKGSVMTVEEVELELADIAEQMRPLRKRSADLQRELRRLRSKAFISANRVERDDVEMSSGDGKPWFGTVFEFAKWMKANKTTKRFCEWNETIYFTAEIIAGRMDPDASATINELE